MTLCLHAGARNVLLDEVIASTTPEPSGRHKPVPHGEIVRIVKTNLLLNGWELAQESYGLWGEQDEMMFGTMDVTRNATTDDENGYSLSVGIRNSHNKRFSAGVAVGSRVFICDNMAFSGQIVYMRRHTKNILWEFDERVVEAVNQLDPARQRLAQRFDAYRKARVENEQIVHDLLIRSVDADVLPITRVPNVLEEWRKPSHEEFEERNIFSLFNAYTETLKGTDPLRLTARTETLHEMCDDLSAQLNY